MTTHFDLRRTLIYLGFAFGIAIAATIVIALTGGLEYSQTLFMLGPTPISVTLVLLTLVYMYAPTYSHILTRIITREGWAGLNLRPNFRRGWGYWLLGFVHPALLTISGAALFFVIFPQYFDPQMTFVVKTAAPALKQAGQNIQESAIPALIMTQAFVGILAGTVINCIFTFGEEFGWRSYLLARLMPLGWRKAMLLMGLIWGMWHWPILALGYNYGFDVPGAPWSGMLAFIVFTWSTGTVLAWLAMRAGSVWPAVIGHGAINACVGLGVLFAQGQPSRLLGPMPIGLIAVIPWVLVASWLLLKPGRLGAPAEPKPAATLEVGGQPA